MWRLVVLLALLACGGSKVSEKRQPAASGTSAPAPTGKPGPLGCIEDAAAKQACVGKGEAFQYSYPAPRHCSGVDRGDEPPEPTPACECIEKQEYARLADECSKVP